MAGSCAFNTAENIFIDKLDEVWPADVKLLRCLLSRQHERTHWPKIPVGGGFDTEYHGFVVLGVKLIGHALLNQCLNPTLNIDLERVEQG